MRTDGPQDVHSGTSVVLRVLRTSEVKGVVINDEGPLRGAKLVALLFSQVAAVSIDADVEGRFTTKLINGEHLFAGTAPGYGASEFHSD